MTSDTKQNDLAFDTVYILYTLASNYTGETKSEMSNLAERIKTDHEISDGLRDISIANLKQAVKRLRDTDDSGSFQYAASILFDIFSATYQIRK